MQGGTIYVSVSGLTDDDPCVIKESKVRKRKFAR